MLKWEASRGELGWNLGIAWRMFAIVPKGEVPSGEDVRKLFDLRCCTNLWIVNPFHTELSRIHWIDDCSVSIEHLAKKNQQEAIQSPNTEFIMFQPDPIKESKPTNERLMFSTRPFLYLRPRHRGRQTIRHLLQLLGIHGVQLSPGCMDQAEIAHLETCGLRDTQRWGRKQLSWWMNQTKLDS